jgi:hypothetical protein
MGIQTPGELANVDTFPGELKDSTSISKDNVLSIVNTIVHKTYLQNLSEMDIVDCPDDIQKIECSSISSFFKINRFVTEKNEDNRDKLISVFQSIACFNCSLIVLIKSDGNGIDYYLGVRANNLKDNASLTAAFDALSKTLRGYFPGTEIIEIGSGKQFDAMLKNVFQKKEKLEKQPKEICTVTGIAGIRSKDEAPQKFFVQGMEKLVDSMQGECYSLLIIADPVDSETTALMKNGYEQLASHPGMIDEETRTYGTSKNESYGTNISVSYSKSINKSISDTLSYTRNKSHNYSSGSHGKYRSKSEGTDMSTGKQKGRTVQTGDGEQSQVQNGYTYQISLGESENTQFKVQNFTIKELQKKLEKHLERLNKSADFGMWNCAAYCLADSERTVHLLASLYQSLLRGENSSIEISTITKWSEDKSKTILPWLEKMHHPYLEAAFFDNGPLNRFTPSSFIHSAELSIHAGIPQRSVSGLPVLQMVSFGRGTIKDWSISVNENNHEIQLGNVHHLGNDEKNHVCIDIEKISEHVFVTGSTGTGKSNTTYHLMYELMKKNKNFLVIEPAKGEYKNVFGGRDDVKVYGTNDKITDLLKINPFSFPPGIHVIEHIERLIEIFNICWPMEAAMPAVLKKAVIAAYEEAGWNLVDSKCTTDALLGFGDVTINIRKVIKEYKWNEEIQGNYEGCLVTRLESLTNGIYSRIFVKKEMDLPELFDKNVIIDLSRIGSSETKALIMGVLMIKLQEYRIASRSSKTKAMNEHLKHITVLEEAHNLLKRTSNDYSGGSGNVAAKAVEMLSNAIAEMRTYGEGFIIVDQAPGLLDMSVIRNTNTKIIHKLPDKTDRELVGLAAMLTEDQVTEIARLQRGVAAIYQSNWIEPVLCKVTKFPENEYKSYIYTEGVKACLN